jgi:hypothetical protein
MGLVLLRYSEEGLSRVGSLRRARTDLRWRHALGLPLALPPPDEKTLRSFEAYLQEPHPRLAIPRYQVCFEAWARLVLTEIGAGRDAVWVIDSTPMWCYGAVLDTVRLLGDGLRQLARRWARAHGQALADLPDPWPVPFLLAKSTKGFFAGRTWTCPADLSAVLDILVQAVHATTAHVLAHLATVRENKHRPLARLCRNLLRVVAEDLGQNEAGQWTILPRCSRERLISLTDEAAQHFRKSHSQVFAGFKIHVLGDAVSGVCLALSVRPGGEHDNTQAHPLIVRARALYAQIQEVLGDAAYGGIGVRLAVAAETGVALLAPPLEHPPAAGKLGKASFAIDFVAQTARCPGGVSTADTAVHDTQDGAVRSYRWPKDSASACTCREACPVHRDKRRTLRLHPEEQALRAARAHWEQPEVRARYRRRSEGERLMGEATRHGTRQAQSFGLASAELQATLALSAQNLRLLARARASPLRRAA